MIFIRLVVWVMLGCCWLMVATTGCDSEPEIVTTERVNPDNEQNIPGWFYSNELHSNRTIYLRLPDNYDASSVETYPTIYLLDANWYFDGSHERISGEGIVGVVNQLVNSNDMPDPILVGIGNLNTHGTQMRGEDFHSESTPDFLSFIKRELIPEINARFNKGVNSKGDRVLIGHSSGGYFSTHALFQNSLDTLFSINNYISLSVFGNDSYVNITSEEAIYAQSIRTDDSPDLKLFMGVGGSEEERFLITYNGLKDSLTSRNYTDFDLETKIYDGHGHSSYISEAVSDGLIFLFRP